MTYSKCKDCLYKVDDRCTLLDIELDTVVISKCGEYTSNMKVE